MTERVACYCRVSSDEQAERHTVEEQFLGLQRLVAFKQWEVAGVFYDPGVSGTLAFRERPEGARLLEAIERKEVDVVAVYNVKRLARRMKVAVDAVELFTEADVAFVSVQENFDTTTPYGRAALGIAMVFAQLDRDTIVEQTTSGKHRRIRAGKFSGPFAPYGYTYNKETGLLTEEPEQAAVVRWIFERAAQGDSLKSLVKQLEAKEVPPPQKARTGEGGKWGWQIQTVSRMLRAERYTGKGAFGDTPMTYGDTPMIPRALFDEVQAGLAERRYRSPGHTKRPYPLQGLLVCGHCGSTYTPRTNAPNRSVEASGQYGCQERMAYGKKKAGHEHVRWLYPAHELEQRLWRYALRLLFEPDHLLSEAKWLNEQARQVLSESSKERVDLQKRLARAEADEKRVVDLACSGDISAQELRERRKKIRAERKDAEQALAAIPEHADSDAVATARMLVDWSRENMQMVREIDALREALPERLGEDIVARVEALPIEARTILDALVWKLFRQSTQRVTVQDDGGLLVEGRPLPLSDSLRDSPCS